MIRIGTRGSALALAQSTQVQRRLVNLYPSMQFKLVIIRTAGDEFQSVELFKKTNVGVFTKAIERELVAKKIDIAVHSLKDLPTKLHPRLALGAIPKRLDAADVLISSKRVTVTQLPLGAFVGTGSPRRKRQLAALRPDLRLVDIRGNLDTRILKVIKKRELDAVVVARAGLLRLKKYLKYARPISPKEMLPAVGQAALGIQIRKSDSKLAQLLKGLHHEPSSIAVNAERALLEALHGGCRVPLGVYSTIKNKQLYLKASVFSVRGVGAITADITGNPKKPEVVGRALAKKLLKLGAGSFLKEARREKLS